MEDIKIIQLLKQRSQYDEGMQELIKKYGGLVKYMLANILGRENVRDIEACLTDVFSEFWKHIEMYDLNKGNLKNYLVGIARYTALNRYHILCKYQNRNILIDEEKIEGCKETDLESQIIKEIDHSIIKEEILKMDSPDKEIFIRRFF